MLRAIYQSTHEASTFIDKNLIIRYNNKVARDVTEQVFGKAAKPGDWSLDYVLPELRSDFEDYYGRALEGESIITEQSDGANWWLFSIYPVTDSESGEIIGIAHNVQDITERKKRELELRESEARLQKTIEAIPNPLLIVDENVLIRYVNRDFEQVFGFHESEVLGKEIEILLPERYREKHTRLHQDYMREGGKSMRMGRFLTALTKSGDEIIVDASLNTFFVNGKRFVIIILQDVTELKKRQDTIAKQNEKLREIARQQSHELRRPLANILGLCDLLQNYGNESEANKAKFIELMLISAKELDAIVHKIVFEAQTEY
jgi:PAS domain S-box-containing protein